MISEILPEDLPACHKVVASDLNDMPKKKKEEEIHYNIPFLYSLYKIWLHGEKIIIESLYTFSSLNCNYLYRLIYQ